MAYITKSGKRFDSGFDPVVEHIKRIGTRSPTAMVAGIAHAREILSQRHREELPGADGVRFARWRIFGSILDLRTLRDGAGDAGVPDELTAFIDEVLAEAVRAHDAAPDFDPKPAAPMDPVAEAVADWVPAKLGGPARSDPRSELAIIEIDLD